MRDAEGFGPLNRTFRNDVLPRILAAAGAEDGATFYRCVRCAALLKVRGSDRPKQCLEDQGGCGRPADETRFDFVSKGATPEALAAGIAKVAHEMGEDPEHLREMALTSFALSGEYQLPGADDYSKLVAAYRRCFRVEDTAPLDVCLAAVATSGLDGDPLWAYVVGPPSSGKTEVLRAFDGLESTYFLSSLTPNCLVSGLRDGRDLLPELDGKALIIKDFTMTLEMHRENRDALFGALRDAYDGSFSKAFGTIGTKRYDARFNLLAGVTNAIEEYYSAQAVLGQRFLIVRTAFPDDFETDADRDVEAIREEMRGLARAALESAAGADPPNCSPEIVREVKALATEVALLRAHVHRDGYTHEIASLPEPEAPARLANQLLKLARGLAIMRRKPAVTEDELEVVRRVARDTVPSLRLRILEVINDGARTIDDVARTTGLARRTVEHKVEDLVVLGALSEDSSGKPYVYAPREGLVLVPTKPAEPPPRLGAAELEKVRTHMEAKARGDPGRPASFLARDAALALQLPGDDVTLAALEAIAVEVRRGLES